MQIAITAYSSLGSAARPAKYQHATEPVLLDDPTIRRIAAELEKSVGPMASASAGVALAWALHHGLAIIPKSTHPARIASNMRAAGIRLSHAQLDALDALDRNHRFLASGWHQYAWRPEMTLDEIWDEAPLVRPDGGEVQNYGFWWWMRLLVLAFCGWVCLQFCMLFHIRRRPL